MIKYIYSFHFDRQYQEKEKIFKKELSTLSTLLPTLHTHLVTCSAFTSSANRFEFLDLAYVRIFSWIFVLYYWISIFWESFFFSSENKICIFMFRSFNFSLFSPQILMDRLKSIINQQHPLHPSQSGQISTHYKVQYSK